MASTYLTRAVGSVDEQRFTWSFWVKRAKLGVEQHLVGNYNDNQNRTHVFFDSSDTLRMYSELSNSIIIQYETNRKFRDTNGWYHIVVAIDTTQAGGNRIRFYVNGEEETSFAQETECNQNTSLDIRSTHYIGTYGGNAGNASYTFDGSMSHLHFIDGTQYTPSNFGSTDSTTGEWKINTSPSVTYGSQGYFILKDGNSITDQSGNSNNFTVAGGTLTNTEDCPSNVFATLNPLDRIQSNATYSNGNNTWTTTSGYYWSRSTIGVSSGKYYFEAKLSSSPTHGHIGIVDEAPDSSTDSGFEDDAYNWGYKTSDGKVYNNGNGGVSYGSTYTTGDIIGVALDLDNNKLYFSKNGTWQNSGDPTSGATGTGAISITDPSSTNTGNYFFAVGDNASATNGTWQTNFGNGYFGTTAVSSAGTNASNIGIFEYDVPTGYTALSTKGLNE